MHTSTRQPRWKLIANLGDVNPLEYGGLFVYTDRTGVYAAEMERIESLSEYGDRRGWQTHRVVLERCTFIDGVLSDNPYHPAQPAWFADRLGDVARTMDTTEIALIGALCGDDPIALAGAYREIADYYGWENFDSYPRTYATRSDLPRRFRRVRASL